MTYKEKKAQLLTKTNKIYKTIENLLQNDQNHLIFSISNRKQIENIKNISEKILKKVNSEEFEIAIVGLEKAGKSTFANALIKRDILPTAPERCTFKSTKLVKSESNSGRIHFYTKSEFEEIFHKLLSDIKYPNYKNINYLTFDSETFKQEFQKLEELDINLYKLHSGKTDEEILDLLKFRNSLELDQKDLFFDDSQIETDEFTNYIKGIKTNNIVDTGKPRSVKNIEIFSKQLKAFENPIIYDVPGFDSPTEIHERETITRLKEADAIILVTNVGDKPNLTAQQLKIIKENTDNDGIVLKEKLFIFGNKFDTANSLEIAENNFQTLISDAVKKYKISINNRVYKGSASKYLHQFNMDKKVQFQNNYDFSNEDIDRIREDLVKYQQNDRFELLSKRLDHLTNQIIDILLNIKKTLSVPEVISKESLICELKLKAQLEILGKLPKNLNEIKYNLIQEFEHNRYFSDKFINKVSEYFQKISIEDIENLIPEYGNDFDRINSNIRNERLYSQFLKDFSNLVKIVVDQKAYEIRERILIAFISAIKNSPEIRQKAEKVFTIEKQSGKFNYLFERFGLKILDLIILYPVLNGNRKKEYFKYKEELLFLDNNYKKDGRIFNIVITGKNEPLTQNMFDIFKQEIVKSLSSEPKNFLLDMSNIFFPKLDEFMLKTYSFDDQALLTMRRNNYDKFEVLNEINTDILNFKTILTEAIIPILNLETVFIEQVKKEIVILISNIKNQEQEIINFISSCLDIYLEQDIAEIDQKINEYKNKKAILDEIETFIKQN